MSADELGRHTIVYRTVLQTLLEARLADPVVPVRQPGGDRRCGKAKNFLCACVRPACWAPAVEWSTLRGCPSGTSSLPVANVLLEFRRI